MNIIGLAGTCPARPALGYAIDLMLFFYSKAYNAGVCSLNLKYIQPPTSFVALCDRETS